MSFLLSLVLTFGIVCHYFCRSKSSLFRGRPSSNPTHSRISNVALTTMSQPPSPFPQSQFYSSPQIMNPINPDTPPPPPPKPGSHEASRGGTPQSMSAPHAYHPDQTQTANIQQPYIPDPPTIEEGWLPDLVKDKS